MADETLSQWLKKLNLDRYETLFIEQGAENLTDIQDLDQDEIKELAASISMKPFHIKKLIKAHEELKDQVSSPDDCKDCMLIASYCILILYKL